MSTLGQDLRYATRTLTNSRGFTLVAILTLAIGVGANVAIFSFVDGILLKPLPYDQPERIVLVVHPAAYHGRISPSSRWGRRRYR